jgi:ATP/maltotriose-dependent transcriptional regulator MalT
LLAIYSARLPVYVRGLAYLQAREGTLAAAEFQKFLDHRGVVINSPLAVLARLGLARAHALPGDRTAARQSYQDFLALWKDADIAVLKQARAEYARLQ